MAVTFSSSERLKRRYVLVRGDKKDIERALLDYLGILGWAKAAPVFLPADDGKLIVAVERKELVHARAALALAKENLDVLRVSGTLNGLGMHVKKSKSP